MASFSERIWQDGQQALEFVQQRLEVWGRDRVLEPGQVQRLRQWCAQWQQEAQAIQAQGQYVAPRLGLFPPSPEESSACRSYRYWRFLQRLIRQWSDQGIISLAQEHDLLSEVRQHLVRLGRQLLPSDWAHLQRRPAEAAAAVARLGEPARAEPPPGPPAPVEASLEDLPLALPVRRSLLELLLDPRSIQLLLASGGILLVLGLVLLLWLNKLLTPPVMAVVLGLSNLLVLLAGWGLLRQTRYQLAGRGLTLLACLVMPLNLWYYHANDLLTLSGPLWVAALVISLFYLLSAVVVREEVFVYVFMGGLVLTGLLFIASWPPALSHFWEIAPPATFLVCLALASLHAEWLFPAGDGPFTRQHFGRAFFYAGHVLLAAGLSLVLAAYVAGDWLYEPFFRWFYSRWNAQPSPIVGELRWLALLLVLAGTYAYVYSDLVAQRGTYFVYLAAATGVWALELLREWLRLELTEDLFIGLLACLAAALHVVLLWIQDRRYTRSLPWLALGMLSLALFLGLVVYLRALDPSLRQVWPVEPPRWNYVGALVLTALSCRLGAFVYRHWQPALTWFYFFATGAATLLAATAFLAALGLTRWEQHAPWLMLLPIAYLIAAHLYGQHSPAQPLWWVSQWATGIMLFSSLASATEGFVRVRHDPLNLMLALFFTEAAGYYSLALVYSRRSEMVYLATATACAAVWQVLAYWQVSAPYYTLTFALIGLALLLVYRLAPLSRATLGPLAPAIFHSANALLLISFVSSCLISAGYWLRGLLGQLTLPWSVVWVTASLALIHTLALGLVRALPWRAYYLVGALVQGALALWDLLVQLQLSPERLLEVACVLAGLMVLAAAHVGWYREQERENDLVTLGLLFGSLLVGVPLAVATLVDRSHGDFLWGDELGFFTASVLLLVSGVLLQLKITTLVGAGLTALYFLALLFFVPWGHMNAVAVFFCVVGGLLFSLGLVLSLFRDHLKQLPERARRREGIFRILNWR
jgi:hypothetical protein